MLLKFLKLYQKLSCYFIAIFLLSCNSQNNQPIGKTYTGPCGCVLSDKEMISQCPLDAIGDSVAICKVGTNNVIGSNRPPMTWPEYIASDYFGGEGLLVDCKTGKNLFSDVRSPIISYKNKKLIVDNRSHFDIYDSKKKYWVDIELPVWRKIVYAVKSELRITPDSLIFKPPFHGQDAFTNVAKEYEDEVKRTNHYLITRTVNRLMICGLCGDKLSQKRLLNIRNDFSDYYSNHEDSQIYLDESLKLFQAYTSYINNGGKREYYDLTKFVSFKNK